MHSYQDSIRPWAIFHRLPTGLNQCVSRFKKRSDADAYMSILRQGGGVFEVVFDYELPDKELNKHGNGTQARY